ncbi:MAG: rhodanese-like domain-containing protein [Thermoleophilia bacterium]|nr:rhodanese-like domain-containing protein [Thermoleophilia bacterium]
MRPSLLALALLGLLSVAACSGGAQPDASPGLLTPAEFELAVADPKTVAINVHVPDEGSIEGTELSIPFDHVEELAGELPADRSTPLAVYCMSGRMSAVAVETLSELGYAHVVELGGGMVAWQATGRPVLAPP